MMIKMTRRITRRISNLNKLLRKAAEEGFDRERLSGRGANYLK